MPTTGVADKTVSGTSSGATSTSTSATGTLHADGQSALVGGRLARRPTNPSGYTERLNAERHVYRLPRLDQESHREHDADGHGVSHDTARPRRAQPARAESGRRWGTASRIAGRRGRRRDCFRASRNIKANVAAKHDPYTDDTKELLPGLMASRRTKSSLPASLPAGCPSRHVACILRVVGRVDRKRRLVARRSEGGLTMPLDYIAIIRDDNTCSTSGRPASLKC